MTQIQLNFGWALEHSSEVPLGEVSPAGLISHKTQPKRKISSEFPIGHDSTERRLGQLLGFFHPKSFELKEITVAILHSNEDNVYASARSIAELKRPVL